MVTGEGWLEVIRMFYILTKVLTDTLIYMNVYVCQTYQTINPRSVYFTAFKFYLNWKHVLIEKEFRTVIKSTGSEAKLPGFELWLHHFLGQATYLLCA